MGIVRALVVGTATLLVTEKAPPCVPFPPDTLATCALPILPDSSTNIEKFLYSESLTPNQTEAIQFVLAATVDNSLQFKITQHESEIDGHIAFGFRGMGQYDGEAPTTVTYSDWMESGFQRINALGQFRVVEFCFERDKIHLPPNQCFRDKFGHITSWWESNGCIKVRILPRSGFCENDTRGELPVSLGLSAFGLKDLTNCFTCHALAPIMSDGPYQIYTNMNRTITLNTFGPDAAVLISAVKECEDFFGVTHGTFVQQIALVNARQPNGFFCCRDPHAILITDEVMRDDIPLASIARHETIHVIDDKIDGEKLLVEIFHRLRSDASGREILNCINESNFLPNDAFGGHAGSNPSELFASFVNSFVSTTQGEWEKAIEKGMAKNRQFPVVYGQLMQAIEPALNMLLAPNTPAADRITEMRCFLEALYERENLCNPWGPVYG